MAYCPDWYLFSASPTGLTFTWLTLLHRQPGDLVTSICFGSHVSAPNTLTLLIKALATVTVYRRHRQTLLPALFMCIGIIRNNSSVDGGARAESNPGHWVRHALLHMAAGLESPPGMPGISPALVTLVPGTALAKDIPAGDTIIPGWGGSLRLCLTTAKAILSRPTFRQSACWLTNRLSAFYRDWTVLVPV